MSRFTRIFHVCILVLATAALGRSQSAHWEPSSGTLAFNQTTELQLVFDGCEPKEDPATPAVPGLQLQSVGQSSNMSIVNGRVSQSVTLTYHARAGQRGAITIPSFAVTTSKGRLNVPAATYQVGDATVGQANVALDSVANSKIDIPQQVWAGEVFRIEYTLNVARRYFHSPGSNQPEWNPAPLAVEEWGKPEVMETMVAGESRISIVYRTRGYARTGGDVTLNPASQLVNLSTGTPSFGFFARPNLEQYAITSSRPNFTVRELPSGAPAGFNGAVGQFKLESKIVPTSSSVGEPITWTLTLSGTGNWPDINGLPPRDVSRDFRVVQPQARRNIKEGALFEGTLTEDVVLIPTQPGNYTLGPVTWSYFDPAKGQYQTITTEKVAVVVAAPPVPASSQTSPGTTNIAPTPNATSSASNNGNPPVTAPAAPTAIPRDALPGSAAVGAPWSTKVFALTLLAPVPFLLVLWLAFAWRRARWTDPFRKQREARQRLKTTISALRETKNPERLRPLLESWQRDAAILWNIPSAVPAVHHFALRDDPAGTAVNSVWPTLWAESERTLYGVEANLPADWVDRADAALAEKTVPRFSAFQLFQGRNLLPFAAAVLLTILAAPQLVADEGKPLYDRGDFVGAETAWRQSLAAHGTDWIARHNLALALAQQSRWGEASAQATAAFVQHPRDASVQWHMTLFSDRTGFAPGSLSAFVHPSPVHSIALQFSPAEWQRVLVGAVALAVAGCAAFLFQAYFSLGRWPGVAGALLLGAAMLIGLAGAVSLNLYQEAGDVRAALVWKPSILRSIPTEADTTQKTSPLAAGSLAIVDKTFLGWSRLAFPNGQTGWVRQEDLVSLWK